MNLPRTPTGSASGWRPVDPPRRPVLFVNPRSGGGKAARAGLAERARERGVEAVVLDRGAGPGRAGPRRRGGRRGRAGGGRRRRVTGGRGRGGGCARDRVRVRSGRDPQPFRARRGRGPARPDRRARRVHRWGRAPDRRGGGQRPHVREQRLARDLRPGGPPAYRDAKVRTLLATAEEVLGPSGEAPALRLADDAGHEHRDPAVVLVSSSPYALDNPLAAGTRPALDTGRLGIVVLGVPGGTSLRPGRAWTAPRLEVSARRRYTPGSTARRRTSARRCGSPSGRPRCGSGSPRDIRAGQAAGCFTVTDAQIALSAVAGGLLGLLRSRERHPERVDETSVDQLTEACLRLLGVPASEAARLVASCLPPCRGGQPVISIWSTTAVTACPWRSPSRISFLGLQRTAGVSRLGVICPAPTRSRVISSPKRNPPTWAKNAAPPPSALALNNPKLPSISWYRDGNCHGHLASSASRCSSPRALFRLGPKVTALRTVPASAGLPSSRPAVTPGHPARSRT